MELFLSIFREVIFLYLCFLQFLETNIRILHFNDVGPLFFMQVLLLVG